MQNTMNSAPNLMEGFLLDPSGQIITINLVIIIFSCCAVVASVVIWVVYKFQTKEEAKEVESRFTTNLLAESLSRKAEVEGLHKHMNSMREENKNEIQRIQNDLSSIRQEWTSMAKDLAYIRGRLEPKP